MKQSRVLTATQALWVVCLVIGFLILSRDITPDFVPGFPIRVNLFSIVHTVGYLGLFLATHWLVFRGQAGASDLLATLIAATFIYMFAMVWLARDPDLFFRWMFILTIVLAVEGSTPDWPKRLTAKVKSWFP